MLPSHRHPAPLPPAQPRHTQAEADLVQGWLAHVEAGRLGYPTVMSPAELAVQRANEMAVLGRTPSFPARQAPRASAWGR